jgi:hypothetical protein
MIARRQRFHSDAGVFFMKKFVLILILALGLSLPARAGNLVDASGSLSSGSSQLVIAANTSVPFRAWLFFQNISTHTMWINFGAAANADQPSIQVTAGSIFRMDQFISDDALNVIGTNGDKFVCKYK